MIEGWLPQGEETYRWIAKEGSIEVKKGNWNQIYMSGYVPKEFDMVTDIKIEINDEEVFEKE